MLSLADAVLRAKTSDTPVLRSLVGIGEAFSRAATSLSPESRSFGSVLVRDPPVIFCTPQPRPFGAAHYFASRYPQRPFVFLSPILFSVERRANAVALAIQHRLFRRRHPGARLVVLANTRREEDLLRRLGVDVRFAPQNMFTDETWYHPVPGRTRAFDAVYNAQLAPFKRHALARLVPSCLYVTKLYGPLPAAVKKRRVAAFLDDLPPGHAVLNRVEAEDFAPVLHVEVNEALASAHVGLCLSRIEGAMYASIEYLLAGLPVVSTRSFGGRDVFFHPDTTLVVNNDPREVRDAVAALKARALPHAFVRDTTLRLVSRERERFNGWISELAGGRRTGDDPRWTFRYQHKLYHSVPTIAALEEQLDAA